MKPSTIIATILSVLAVALAGPAIKTPVPPKEPHILVDAIPGNLKRFDVPWGQIDDLVTCLKEHDGYHTNFAHAETGNLQVTNVDITCCEKAKSIWSLLAPREGRRGDVSTALFTTPCRDVDMIGLTVSDTKLVLAFFQKLGHW